MKLWKILGIELYEVGDIFINMSGNNPGNRFKGTWELIAQGRTLVGVDTTDSDFNTVRKSGGSKYLQKHSHNLNFRYGTDPASSNYQTAYNGYPLMGSATTPRGSTPNSILETGDGNSGNLQPYLTTYIWERVS